MPLERTFVAAPIVAPSGRVLASPFQFYTTGEESLRVLSVNALIGVGLKIQARALDQKGTINANAWDHYPRADRSVVGTDYELGTGALLNLVVFATGAQPIVGQTFVIVQLVRGSGPPAVVLGVLLQGYVTTTQVLAWPGSPIQNTTDCEPPPRLIFGATPGLGQEVNEAVPTGARWRLCYFQARLFTSAFVIQRGPRLTYNQGFPGKIHLPASGTSPPSVDRYYSWSDGSALDQDHSSNVSAGALPGQAVLKAGQVVATNTENIQLTDQWTNVTYTVQEWLEVP